MGIDGRKTKNQSSEFVACGVPKETKIVLLSLFSLTSDRNIDTVQVGVTRITAGLRKSKAHAHWSLLLVQKE